MPKYEILQEIARLNRRGDSSLCLDKVKFDEGGPAYDLRVWYFRPYGERDPGRGIMLRENELQTLYRALQTYYGGKPEKKDPPEVPLVNDMPF